MTLRMDQEVRNLAFLKSACQRSLRDRWRNSRQAPAINGLALRKNYCSMVENQWSVRLISQAYLVDLVCLVYLVHLVSIVQPNKRDKPDQPNNDLLYAGGR